MPAYRETTKLSPSPCLEASLKWETLDNHNTTVAKYDIEELTKMS